MPSEGETSGHANNNYPVKLCTFQVLFKLNNNDYKFFENASIGLGLY